MYKTILCGIISTMINARHFNTKYKSQLLYLYLQNISKIMTWNE
jgi:hypothetical protein